VKLATPEATTTGPVPPVFAHDSVAPPGLLPSDSFTFVALSVTETVLTSFSTETSNVIEAPAFTFAGGCDVKTNLVDGGSSAGSAGGEPAAAAGVVTVTGGAGTVGEGDGTGAAGVAGTVAAGGVLLSGVGSSGLEGSFAAGSGCEGASGGDVEGIVLEIAARSAGAAGAAGSCGGALGIAIGFLTAGGWSFMAVRRGTSG
jgi:hypothetical protein